MPLTNSSSHPSGSIMAFNKLIQTSVGADSSCPSPIYRPSPDGLLSAINSYPGSISLRCHPEPPRRVSLHQRLRCPQHDNPLPKFIKQRRTSVLFKYTKFEEEVSKTCHIRLDEHAT